MRNKYFNCLYRKFSNSSTALTKNWIEPQKQNGYDTGIKVYNCIERKLVPLIIRNKCYATWYTCGPTVYDSAHIGHASCFVKLDIIQRILKEYFQINLITAMNVTDIDDKIIQRTNELNNNNNKLINWQDISKKYEEEFWNDMKSLNINEPNIIIRVTDNIPEIIAFICKLIRDDKAYVGNDNSVYFRISSYSNYGKLVTIKNENIKTESNDKNIDFVLWKAQKSKTEPSWASPWGNGRPGWHIECSTLASKLFGNTIDFHAGGLDLKFPHHENEEAQSCSYHNHKQWVNYWIHSGHLKLTGDSEKMSKSLKNTISINELLENYTSDEFRMACILSNYRNSVEFSDDMMSMARNTLNKLLSFQSDCKAYIDGKKSIKKFDENELVMKLNQTEKMIETYLKDDFNTAKCINVMIEFTTIMSRLINSSVTNEFHDDNDEIKSNLSIVVAANNYITRILSIFGINKINLKAIIQNDVVNSNDFINEIVKIRDTLRNIAISKKENYLFKICDDIRYDLQNKSVEIKDHNKGSSWDFIKKSD